MGKRISRRGFVQGATVSFATVASAALLGGCTEAREASSENESSEMGNWDYEADLVVVGAGTAVFGAIEALHNDKSVIIVEKAANIGGTTIFSGGNTLWIPRNHKLGQDGLEEDYSEEEVLEYLKAADVYNDSTEERKRDYIHNACKVIENVENDWGYKFIANSGKGDYYQLPYRVEDKRRCMQWANLEGEGPLPATDLWAKVYQPELDKGNAQILTETEATKLILNELNAVIGINATSGGKDITIKANTGVLLACGGFDWDEDMCRRFLRAPIHGSMVVSSNTGDGIRMGMSIGADLEGMTQTQGGVAYVAAGETENDWTGLWSWGAFAAHSVLVNKRGRRFANESASYGTIKEVFGAYDMKTFTLDNIPAYLIFSEGFKELGKPWPTGLEEKPDWVSGFDSLDELASALAIDPDSLKEEIARFNGFCETGIDEDFGRGSTTYDINNIPEAEGLANKCLGPISSPYYVAKITTSSLGTRGGLRVNTDHQVLHVNGEPIEGLYASGTAASSPLGGTYPGAGSAIGPGSYGSYKAVNHINLDFNSLNRAVMTVLTNRLRMQKGSRLRKVGRPLTEAETGLYGRTPMLRFVAGSNEPIYPIGYVQHKAPWTKKKKANPYTTEGRKEGHNNLRIDTSLMVEMMRSKSRSQSVEFSDNRISLFSAQWGKCAVTGREFQCLEDIHCHHKLPKSLGGTDQYDNLVLVLPQVHRLIHATEIITIEKYMSMLELDQAQIAKLNKYREKANNAPVQMK